MNKNEKLVVGKPYSIIVRDNGRMMKIEGNVLTEDDVKYFIDNKILTKDDVIMPEKKENLYPDFVDVVCSIDEKFFPWKYYTYNLFQKYPSIAIALLLKEYASIACSKIKPKDQVYLVSKADGEIMQVKNSRNVMESLAAFPTEDSAKKAFSDVINGVKVAFLQS